MSYLIQFFYLKKHYGMPKKALRTVLYLFFKRLETKPPCWICAKTVGEQVPLGIELSGVINIASVVASISRAYWYAITDSRTIKFSTPKPGKSIQTVSEFVLRLVRLTNKYLSSEVGAMAIYKCSPLGGVSIKKASLN